MPKDVKKKQKYEAPELIDLGELTRGRGQVDCEPGSTASDDCEPGGSAADDCYNGSSAADECWNGSSATDMCSPGTVALGLGDGVLKDKD